MSLFYTFYYPVFAFISFFFGLLGVCVLKRNLIIILMSFELMLFGVNILLIYFSVCYDDMVGQIFALTILTVAAAESAIGLAVVVIYYRLRGHILIDETPLLKG
jgi:NADH-quinone oxidoreductase subunit K